MISVVIPTYRRLSQLKRAVEDVRAQTYSNWELIVSDDEVGEGETWQYLKGLPAVDPRIRVLKNTRGGHGQTFNVNSGCFAAKGDWVKIFFDDDRMLPNCLEEFSKLAEAYPAAALIRCRSQIWRNGKYVGDAPRFSKSDVDVIHQADVLLALCTLDIRVAGIPTCMMIRGDLLRRGIGMREDGKFVVPVDTRWYGELLHHGDFVATSAVLVGECQGEVASVTSEHSWKNEQALDAETRAVYLEIYDNAVHDERWPSRLAVDSLICGARTFYYLKKRRFVDALTCFMHALRSPRALLMLVCWLMRRLG